MPMDHRDGRAGRLIRARLTRWAQAGHRATHAGLHWLRERVGTAAGRAEPAAGPASNVPAIVRRRLQPVASSGWRSWAVAAWVVVIAAILRFVKLGFPPQLVFDEIYYAREGQELLDHSVEWRYDYDSAGSKSFFGVQALFKF